MFSSFVNGFSLWKVYIRISLIAICVFRSNPLTWLFSFSPRSNSLPNEVSLIMWIADSKAYLRNRLAPARKRNENSHRYSIAHDKKKPVPFQNFVLSFQWNSVIVKAKIQSKLCFIELGLKHCILDVLGDFWGSWYQRIRFPHSI